MTTQHYPVPVHATRSSMTAPVPFGHRQAPVAFAGALSYDSPRDNLRFEGRITRTSRFPVEAALAMNEVRLGRVGHHVDTRC